MLYLQITGSVVNTVAFYTPSSSFDINVGDEVYINFTHDYSLSSSLVESTLPTLNHHYLTFDISGSDLPQVGGLYTVTLNTEVTWDTYDELWNEADPNWEDYILDVFDSERAFLFELIPDTEFSSSFENANYFTASLNVSGAESYISVRETGTYYVYNGE